MVASSGFGSGIATGDGSGKVNTSRGNGVQKSGFGDTQAVSMAQLRPKQTDDSAGKMVPAEVVFKPTPAYTPEARNLRIEGEVVLEVVFEATGKLRVVRVVRVWGTASTRPQPTLRNRFASNPPSATANPPTTPP